MKIIEAIMTKNPCYKSAGNMTVKGLMLHSVGCPQPSAAKFAASWNSSSYGRACVHAFIDANNGNIYQTLPWNHKAWHCGGSGNNTHIGVEMCEPACINYISGSKFTCSNKAEAKACADRTYKSAVELFAMLCKKYNLNPLAPGVIVSHKEGNTRGIASNHGDPEHFWSGLSTGYTMSTFRNDVNNLMKGAKVLSNSQQPTIGSTSTTSTSSAQYVVRVTADTLNIRQSPSVNSSITGKITDKGAYTIVAESTGAGANKWGKLKSGLGWISLDYTKRV